MMLIYSRTHEELCEALRSNQAMSSQQQAERMRAIMREELQRESRLKRDANLICLAVLLIVIAIVWIVS